MNWSPKPGEKNPNAKLNWQKVREIRSRAENGEKKKDLALAYGVALRTISAVVKREFWREDGSPYISMEKKKKSSCYVPFNKWYGKEAKFSTV